MSLKSHKKQEIASQCRSAECNRNVFEKDSTLGLSQPGTQADRPK
jgi:hypothetical protein